MPNAPSPGSAPASTFEPDVYIVQGVEPEVGAYAMAKYSRSALSLRDSLQELNRDKAEKFLNTFYFQYGHRSIADLAHLSFAVERLSILAAIEVADEPRWDGQERSTRYQRFRSSGVVLPPELDADPSSRPQLEALFAAYEALGPRLEAHLQSLHLRPDAMAEDHYRRAIRARAYDSARYLLPLATTTSLGQIVSARTLEQQIVRLLSSPYAECQALGEALRRAALAPGALPTLVKYTEPSPYLEASAAELTQAAAELMAGVAPDHACGAALAPPAALEIELGASLLYAHTHHSYRQLLEAVEALTPARRDELAALGTRHRGSHDELPRAFQAGLPFQFDILMDIGGFRDLHRHRRCVQLHQGYTAQHGFDTPAAILAAGAEPAYAAAMAAAAAAGARHPATVGAYLLPLGYRKRSLFKMDLAQVAYMAELRTGLGGHFSYRSIAWQMYEALQRRHPSLARGLRVTNPHVQDDPLAR